MLCFSRREDSDSSSEADESPSVTEAESQGKKNAQQQPAIAPVPNPFLKPLESLADKIGNVKLKAWPKGAAWIHTFCGPQEDEGIILHKDIVAAQTVSTYPTIGGQRDGDPICDLFSITIWEQALWPFIGKQRLLFTLADGCGWGRKPKEAAQAATTESAFAKYLCENQHKATTVRQLSEILLLAMDAAHTGILDPTKPAWEIGTTTLIAGLTVPLESSEEAKYCMLAVGVGDSKIYHFDAKKQEAVEVTFGTRPNPADATDCGGRIGPQLPGGKADLRNLRIFFTTCNEGDIFVSVSDGVHDNFDPQYLGKKPSDAGVDAVSWESIPPADLEKFKTKSAAAMLNEILVKQKLNVKDIVTAMVEHCWRTTEPSRKFLQENIGKRLPVNYELYPGKMDHSTCIVWRVSSSFA